MFYIHLLHFWWKIFTITVFGLCGFRLILSACEKTHVYDEKSPGSMPAKSENKQLSYVNECFSDKHNSLSRKSGKKVGVSRSHLFKTMTCLIEKHMII